MCSAVRRQVTKLYLLLAVAFLTFGTGSSPVYAQECLTCFEGPECLEFGTDWTCEFDERDFGCCQPPGGPDAGTTEPADSGFADAGTTASEDSSVGQSDSGAGQTADAEPTTDAGTTSGASDATGTGNGNGNGNNSGQDFTSPRTRRDGCACSAPDRTAMPPLALGLLAACLTLARRRR